jgi:hypothetical protein
MKSGATTSQAGRSSTSQGRGRRRTVLAVAAVIIVGLVVAGFALRRPVHEDAEPVREISRQPGPSPTEQSRTARPALPSLPQGDVAQSPEQPAESAPAPSRHPRPPNPVARKLTETKVQKYVHEAIPAWRRAHPGQDCPQRLSELNEYMGDSDTRDGWGHPLRMLCGPNRPAGAKGIMVVSFGRDGERGNEDDIKAEE